MRMRVTMKVLRRVPRGLRQPAPLKIQTPNSSKSHILHPHHDVLHSYGHSYAQLLNTLMILGLFDCIHLNVSVTGGDTQLIARKLIN